MARLYLKATSDTHETEKTMTANKTLNIEVFYGSKKNSKSLLRLEVYYPKNSTLPPSYQIVDNGFVVQRK